MKLLLEFFFWFRLILNLNNKQIKNAQQLIWFACKNKSFYRFTKQNFLTSVIRMSHSKYSVDIKHHIRSDTDVLAIQRLKIDLVKASELFIKNAYLRSSGWLMTRIIRIFKNTPNISIGRRSPANAVASSFASHGLKYWLAFLLLFHYGILSSRQK